MFASNPDCSRYIGVPPSISLKRRRSIKSFADILLEDEVGVTFHRVCSVLSVLCRIKTHTHTHTHSRLRFVSDLDWPGRGHSVLSAATKLRTDCVAGKLSTTLLRLILGSDECFLNDWNLDHCPRHSRHVLKHSKRKQDRGHCNGVTGGRHTDTYSRARCGSEKILHRCASLADTTTQLQSLTLGLPYRLSFQRFGADHLQ